jgi:hypothetical protein
MSLASFATAAAASVRVVNFSGYVRRDEIGLTLAVPGKVWSDALDPAATGMARELGLPEAVHQSVGRGHQIRYEGLRREQLERTLAYLDEWASSVSSDAGPGRIYEETRRYVLAARAQLERFRRPGPRTRPA